MAEKEEKQELQFFKPMFIRAIPNTVRHDFKKSCFNSGYSMQAVLIGVMRYLNTPEKVKEFME